MDVVTLLLLLGAAVYAAYLYFEKKLSYFRKRGIPHVPGYPVVGNSLDNVLRRRHLVDIIHEVYNCDRDAKYVGYYDFMRPVIVLRDLELIKTIAIKNFDSFPDRTTFVDDQVDPLFGGSLFVMAGDRWRETRNLLSPAFTGSKMKGMFELMVETAENFVKYLGNLDEEKRRMVDTKDLFTRFTNDVIATCAFGISVDSLKEPNNEFYLLGREATDPQNFPLFKFLLMRNIPGLMKFLKIHLIGDKIAKFFGNIVSTMVKTRDVKGIRRPDMIQLMMDARGKEHQHLKLNITEMTAQAFIFFFGGFDTTSSQLCFIAHELAINPEVQEKLQKEIDDYLEKNEGKVTYDTLNEMPYLDAVFTESLRLHGPFLFLDRMCIKEFELPPTKPGAKPFVIKPGMNVWIPNASIHRDPKYYENPDKFDPERYYQKKVSIGGVTNYGFGIGPRACIGNRFAIQETKLLIFYILSKFNLKPNAKTCRTYSWDKKVFNLRPKDGFWLTVEPRT